METNLWKDHLPELVSRAKRSLGWVIAGFAIGYAFADRAVEWIEAPLLSRLPPLSNLIYIGPFEKFGAYLRMALVAGFLLALPFVLWEIWAFAKPALRENEKIFLRRAGILFALTFVIGLGLGYLVVLPAVIQAILSFGSSTKELAQFSMSSYVNTALGILVLSALILEIPVLMTQLSTWGWVSARAWIRHRRIAFAVNAVVAAIFSPPDMASMLVVLIPLQLLYETGILGAKIFARTHQDPREKAFS